MRNERKRDKGKQKDRKNLTIHCKRNRIEDKKESVRQEETAQRGGTSLQVRVIKSQGFETCLLESGEVCQAKPERGGTCQQPHKLSVSARPTSSFKRD